MKKKTIEERIAEELKYSEMVNKKIKKIEKKTKEKKVKMRDNKNAFEFVKEYTYLKEQQKKIENDLMVCLYDITPNMKEGDKVMKDYYYLMQMEKDISKDFRATMNLVKDNINTIKEGKKNAKITREGITNLFKTLKDFNDQLITIADPELDELGLGEDNEGKDNEALSSSDMISLIFNNDPFNTLNIMNIDYLILQEFNQNPEFKMSKKSFPLEGALKQNIKDNLFTMNFTTFKPPQNLQERSLIALGDEKSKQILTQISKAFELVNLKYKKEKDKLQKELLGNLISTTKLNIPQKIKLKCANMNYFTKNFSNISLSQKLSNFNITNRSVVIQYESYSKFLDLLSKIKSQFKISKSAYDNEIAELRGNSLKLLNEEIDNEIRERKEKIEKYDNEQKRKELDLIHQKNKEIYEIKQKYKNEQLKFDRLLNEKKQKEKDEKQRNYNELNKLKTEHYKEQKAKKDLEMKKQLEKEQELERKKIQKEIEKHLPNIIQNHINSTNKYIMNQMQKKIQKEQAEYNEQRLNNIIENYKSRPKVEADPNRLISITKNLKNRYENMINGVPDEDEKAKMFTNNGFTVEHLMKDFRYKVSSALYEAGLIDRQASKDLMLQLAYGGKKEF